VLSSISRSRSSSAEAVTTARVRGWSDVDLAFILMLAAFAADVATFELGSLAHPGLWGDANPVVELTWAGFGLTGIVVLKVLACAAIAGLARWRLPSQLTRTAFLMAAWIGCLGAFSNLPGVMGAFSK
jgi:hypothetical protein